MPRDWNQIAKGIAPEIPQSELEKVILVLQTLEQQLAPLRQSLPHQTEPAVIFPSTPASEEDA